MLIDLRLCIVRKKDGKWWFMREDEREYKALAGPFDTRSDAQKALDGYNTHRNGWPTKGNG